MKEITESTTTLPIVVNHASFWNAIDILINKPHVVNKRLWGCKIKKIFFCKPSKTPELIPLKTLAKLQNSITSFEHDEFLNKALHELNLKYFDGTEADSPIKLILIELLSKSFNEGQGLQIIIVNRDGLEVFFLDISQNKSICPEFPYKIHLGQNEIHLTALCDPNHKSLEWLTKTILPQVIKWSTESSSNVYSQNICKESLSLVPQDKYYIKYNDLKNKYGKEMVKIWPECTDPSKFVYEDVAIATYLLLIWENEQEPTRKQRFVDLGCGNGLLVYILTKEGHLGVGIDVRKRNIWDMYTKDVVLQEKTIIPSDSSLFPEMDWIIGNHSDELTPWIPVIAAKSSYQCNFFLLPCCAYNFDGTKYQRKNSCKSQYLDYLEYIRDLCSNCGFNVKMDRLKIPSTKRICLVGKGRVYDKEKYQEYCVKVTEIVNGNIAPSSQVESSWVADFKPREAVERVRNCTQIDKDLIKSIINCITHYLLEDVEKYAKWHAGKTVEIGELINLISKDQLKQLKSECGGLQTLLKNNHNIFKVNGGKVQLRYPRTIDEVNSKNNNSKNMKIQEKPCWFFNNHPQGCPLLDSKCSFLHEKVSE